MARPTQRQLDHFKSLYPTNEHVQALTLEEVLRNTQGTTVDWNSLQFDQPTSPATATSKSAVTPCQRAIGLVILDVIALAVGAVGLRGKVTPATVDAIAEAAIPTLSKIGAIIEEMMAPGASRKDLAWGSFKILKELGPSLGKIWSAFTKSLTWWDKVLYITMGAAAITAAVATDGVAFVAEITILLANFGALASDSAKVFQHCK